MQLQPVETSSNIAGIGYEAESRTLYVQFKSAGIYRYDDVPPEAHEGFMNAKSIGQHFHRHIKGRFKWQRLDVEEVYQAH